MKDSSRTQPTDSTKQGSHELTETKTASTGSAPGPLCILRLLASCIVGLLTVKVGVSLALLPLLGLFPPVRLPGPASGAFVLSYCILFFYVWLLSLKGLLCSDSRLRRSRSEKVGG